MNRQKGFIPLVILAGVALIGMAAIIFLKNPNLIRPKQQACTQEAKICPDGSAVGRTGPNCEFAPCPTPKSTTSPNETSDWKTYRNEKYGFEIRYKSEWKMLEGSSAVKWYPASSKSNLDSHILNLWWYSPDIRYGIEPRCDLTKTCNKIASMTANKGSTIFEIYRPTEEYRKQIDLPQTFLYAFVINSDQTVTPEFSTELLTIDEFKQVLSTFRFLK
jgi:hypothetical protein